MSGVLMGNHLVQHIYLDGHWYGWCSCETRSEPYGHRWQAEDWEMAHHVLVDRARAHLRDRNPSLKDQARWYRTQAEKATNGSERTQWAMLAHGLEQRLGVVVAEQPLFEVEEQI